MKYIKQFLYLTIGMLIVSSPAFAAGKVVPAPITGKYFSDLTSQSLYKNLESTNPYVLQTISQYIQGVLAGAYAMSYIDNSMSNFGNDKKALELDKAVAYCFNTYVAPYSDTQRRLIVLDWLRSHPTLWNNQLAADDILDAFGALSPPKMMKDDCSLVF